MLVHLDRFIWLSFKRMSIVVDFAFFNSFFLQQPCFTSHNLVALVIAINIIMRNHFEEI